MATTITANGINFPDGSAGSPSIGGTDTNTGLFTGSDIVGFATGGSERLRIDASGNINIANDSGKLRLGTGADLLLYHDGTDNFLTTSNGHLNIYGDGSNEIHIKGVYNEESIKVIPNGAVELYHDNVKSFSTISNGVRVEATESAAAILEIYADEGDNPADKWRFVAGTDGILDLQNYGSGSWYNSIKFGNNTGGTTLYQNNDAKFQTQSDGVRVEDGGTLYFANDSENASSAIRNVGGTGASTLVFTTGGGDRWQILNGGHLVPQANNTYDIGESSYRVRNIYTNDLNLSNEGGSNDVDSTWGSYTIQEGAEDLFLINRRNGKKYKFNLTEVS